MQDGAALRLLVREVPASVRKARECDSDELHRFAEALAAAVDAHAQTTGKLLRAASNGEIEVSLANASVYLETTGHMVVAWIWLRQAVAALRRLPAAHAAAERDFYQGKLQACAYFFRWELPRTRQQNELLNNLDPTCYAMQDAWF